MKFLKRQDSSLSNKILLGSGGIILTILILYLFTGGLTRIHSDSAAPLNIALEMMRTGELFPDGWIGSTGIFTFQLPIWLFLQFIPDYLIAKACAQLLWTFLFIASVIFMCKKLLKNNSWIVGIPVMLTCFSVDVQYDMLFIQCAYTTTVFMTLFTIGGLGSSVQHFTTWELHKKRFVLALLLTLVSCFLGIVAVEALLLPMLGSILILYMYQNRKCNKLNELPSKKRIIEILISISLVGGIGYLCSMKLATWSGVLGNGDATKLATSIEQIVDNMVMLIQGIFFYLGFSTSVSLFSIDGVLTIVRFAFFIALTVVFPILAYRNYQSESQRTQFFLIFSLIHTIESLIVIIFTQMFNYAGVSRYLLTSVVLMNLVASNYIYTRYIKNMNLLSILYSLGISCVTVVMMFPVVKSTFDYQTTLNNMRGLTTYLADQGLLYGYATFWNAGVNTALSNGRVHISGVLTEIDQVQPFYWLTSKDWYERECYLGYTFLLLSSAEVAVYAPNGYENTLLGEPERILTYGDYTILAYDHNISENGFRTPIDETKNYINGFMALSDPSMQQDDGSIVLQSGQVMYGPYIALDTGCYELTVDAELQAPQEMRITAGAGQEQICSSELKNGTTVIPFTLESEKTQVEFFLQNTGSTVLKLTELRLAKQK